MYRNIDFEKNIIKNIINDFTTKKSQVSNEWRLGRAGQDYYYAGEVIVWG